MTVAVFIEPKYGSVSGIDTACAVFREKSRFLRRKNNVFEKLYSTKFKGFLSPEPPKRGMAYAAKWRVASEAIEYSRYCLCPQKEMDHAEELVQVWQTHGMLTFTPSSKESDTALCHWL